MASYAMAHLKMDMLLTETGYKPTDDQRFRIFLTNSLEEAHPDTATRFLVHWLTDEADQANAIKRDAPVMVVIGNPPYSGESANKGEWIMNLMEDYKKEPGGKEKLKERNPKLINDDYVKFIRFGQHFIDKNGSGILAFINPHGYFDNPTFRGMRWNLLKSFDKLFIIDLNGNVKKKKKSIENENDENVFDITTGVSINIFVKSKNQKESSVYYHELVGKRKMKYDFLEKNNIKTIPFKILKPELPEYFLNIKDFTNIEDYKLGFSVSEIFNFYLSGLSTKNDDFCISIDKFNIENKIDDLKQSTFEELKLKYNLNTESSSWSLNGAKLDVKDFDDKKIIEVNYRPFDNRFTYYTGNSMGFMGRPKGDLGKHLIKDNLSLVTIKKSRSNSIWNSIGISNKMICEPTTITSLDGNYGFPLYLYPESTTQTSLLDDVVRTPNLNMEIVNKMANDLGMFFSPEKPDYDKQTAEADMLCPIDILDYIYAVLHSPSYREKYKEFLKIDFPRVPYPKNQRQFIDLVDLGSQLREIHLLESEVVEKPITQYNIEGDNIVSKPIYKEGNVYINETQYFANVPEVAWNFYIGGYQPAQKWLKDRKDRELSYEDIRHYQNGWRWRAPMSALRSNMTGAACLPTVQGGQDQSSRVARR